MRGSVRSSANATRSGRCSRPKWQMEGTPLTQGATGLRLGFGGDRPHLIEDASSPTGTHRRAQAQWPHTSTRHAGVHAVRDQ
jgi:hypothetical protein